MFEMFGKKKQKKEEAVEFKGGKIKDLLEKVSFLDNLDTDGTADEKIDTQQVKKDLYLLKQEIRNCRSTWEEESMLETALKDVLAVLERLCQSSRAELSEDELSYAFMGRLQGIFFTENHISSHCAEKYEDACLYFEKVKRSVENALAFEKRTRSDLAYDAIGNADAIAKIVKNIEAKTRQLEILDSIIADAKSRCEKKEEVEILDCDGRAQVQEEERAELPPGPLVEPEILDILEQEEAPDPRYLSIPESEMDGEETKEPEEAEEPEEAREPEEAKEPEEVREPEEGEEQEEAREPEGSEEPEGSQEPEEAEGPGETQEPEEAEEQEEVREPEEAKEPEAVQEPEKAREPEETEEPEGAEEEDKPGIPEETAEKTRPEGPVKNKGSLLQHLFKRKERSQEDPQGPMAEAETLLKKAGEKRIPYTECRNVLSAPELVLFQDKNGKCYLGDASNIGEKAYENVDGSAYALVWQGLYDLLTLEYDPALSQDADETMLAKSGQVMEWVYEHYVSLTGHKVPLQSYMEYKEYYSGCVEKYMEHQAKERERLGKAVMLSDEISRLLLLFGKAVGTPEECRREYVPLLLNCNADWLIGKLSDIRKHDILDDGLKERILKLEGYAKKPDTYPLRDGGTGGGRGRALPIEDVRFLLKKGSVNGAYSVDSVSSCNLAWLVKEFYATMSYKKELGISYNGENIFLIRYNNGEKRPEAAMTKYEKHMKRYDKGALGEVLEYYEQQFMQMLHAYACYNN